MNGHPEPYHYPQGTGNSFGSSENLARGGGGGGGTEQQENGGGGPSNGDTAQVVFVIMTNDWGHAQQCCDNTPTLTLNIVTIITL